MPTLKSKTVTKKKTTTKAKTKVAVKTKTTKKPTIQVKSPTKAKSKTAAAKAKSTKKPTVKAKSVSTKKTKSSAKEKSKPISKLKLTEEQKAKLLEVIQKIVALRRYDIDGLKSFCSLDHILDQHNQKYSDAHKKFDAVVKLSLNKQEKYTSNIIALPDNGKDAVALYKLLAVIGTEETKFSDANEQIQVIYKESLAERT